MTRRVIYEMLTAAEEEILAEPDEVKEMYPDKKWSELTTIKMNRCLDQIRLTKDVLAGRVDIPTAYLDVKSVN